MGETTIVNDTAVYEIKGIRPVQDHDPNSSRPGRIEVSQDGMDSECGFGHNVNEMGTREGGWPAGRI